MHETDYVKPMGFLANLIYYLSGTLNSCESFFLLILVLLCILFFPLYVFVGIAIVKEYERAVIFRLGRIGQFLTVNSNFEKPKILYIIINYYKLAKKLSAQEFSLLFHAQMSIKKLI